VVYRAIDEGYRVIGIRRGWAGLLYYNPDSNEDQNRLVQPLTKHMVRTIDRTGGTYLHTSRTNPSNVKPADAPKFLGDTGYGETDKGTRDYTQHILRVLKSLEIDALVPIGGDDTLGYGARLHDEGFPVVAIPKTMDNDVFGTDYCIGFSTAVTRSVEFITALRTPAGSHERIAIIELFGRYSGETSLISAYLSGVDRAIISEVPFDVQKLAELLMKDKRENPSNYAIMTISEGARMTGSEIVQAGEADAFGHKKLGGIGEMTNAAIKKLTGQNTIYQQVAYLMRSGAPDALDRMVAISFANLALDLLFMGEVGRMVALQEGKYTHVPGNTPAKGVKQVDVNELYDMAAYRPKVSSMLGKPMFLY
jgi:6-phosphofructokinase 1